MTAHPKKRMSRSRKFNRRAHDHLTLGSIVICSHCRHPHLNHHVCPTCGFYAGREVIADETERADR